MVGYDSYFTLVAWSANDMENGEGGVKVGLFGIRERDASHIYFQSLDYYIDWLRK